jgi:hypothetical protein
MLRHVAFVRTDVSDELSASTIKVTRIGELGTTLAVTLNRPILVTLMKEALTSSKTSVLTRATRRNIPEDAILHSHRRENLKSYILVACFSEVILRMYDLLNHSFGVLDFTPRPVAMNASNDNSWCHCSSLSEVSFVYKSEPVVPTCFTRQQHQNKHRRAYVSRNLQLLTDKGLYTTELMAFRQLNISVPNKLTFRNVDRHSAIICHDISEAVISARQCYVRANTFGPFLIIE